MRFRSSRTIARLNSGVCDVLYSSIVLRCVRPLIHLHPWDRPFGCIRHRSHRAGSEGIPLGSRLRGLDWAGAARGFDRGKHKLGPISKQGDRYLRRILVVGAHAVLKLARQKPEKHPWLTQLLARRPFKVAAVALANKMARLAWALLAKGGTYYRTRALVAPAAA
jgi:hypothetical protein